MIQVVWGVLVVVDYLVAELVYKQEVVQMVQVGAYMKVVLWVMCFEHLELSV